MGHLVILTLISRHPHRIHVSLHFLGYSHVKHFSWDKYLEETNSLPAPARAFKVVSEFALYSTLPTYRLLAWTRAAGSGYMSAVV